MNHGKKPPNPVFEKATTDAKNVISLIADFIADPEKTWARETAGGDGAKIVHADGEARGPACRTCGDRRKVGLAPYQIACPACAPPVLEDATRCRTCGGTGKLGDPSAPVVCPLCQGGPTR